MIICLNVLYDMFMMNGLDRTNAHDFTSSCDATARLTFTEFNKKYDLKYACYEQELIFLLDEKD